MITAQVKHLHSPDVANLVTYLPPADGRFGFLLQIIAAPSGQDAEDSFDVIVCSPNWLADKLGAGGVLVGRHHLIMLQYDYERLRQFLASYCAKCTGNTWRDVAEQLGRLGRWEFEDYQP